jgi:hypothetical protein
MDTQIIDGINTLNHERCATIGCGISKQICNNIMKWVEEK